MTKRVLWVSHSEFHTLGSYHLFRTLKYTPSKQWNTVKMKVLSCFLSQRKWNNKDIIAERLNLCCKVVLKRTTINHKNNLMQTECWQTHSTNEIPSIRWTDFIHKGTNNELQGRIINDTCVHVRILNNACWIVCICLWNS